MSHLSLAVTTQYNSQFESPYLQKEKEKQPEDHIVFFLYKLLMTIYRIAVPIK